MISYEKDEVIFFGIIVPVISTLMIGTFFATVAISKNKASKRSEEIENSKSFNKENILVVEDLPTGPDYFVYENVWSDKDYYSPSKEEWFSINPKNVEDNSIVSNSIFPLEFYLTDEEKKKGMFTQEELEEIMDRVAKKDASLTLSRKLV